MVEALLEQAAWLTPTSLFLFLNLVIATIVFSHRRTNNPDNTHHDSSSSAAPPPYNPPQLARSPSLFSRVTSFNLSNYYPHPHHDHDQDQDQDQDQDRHDPPPSFFSRVASFKFSDRANEPGPKMPEPEPEAKTELKRAVVRSPSFLSRVASFTVGGRGYMQEQVCEVVAQCNDKGDDEGKKMGEKVKKGKKKKKVERVETASFRKNEEEVDAKADDFINRFKQQLKLQRIESLMRYRST